MSFFFFSIAEILKVKTCQEKVSTISLWNPYKKEVNIQNTAVRYLIEEQKDMQQIKHFLFYKLFIFLFMSLFLLYSKTKTHHYMSFDSIWQAMWKVELSLF